MGEIQNVRTPGTYFDFWLTESYQKYDAKVQNVDIQTQAYSKDAQTMDIAMTVQFRVQQDKVKEIAATYGNLDAVENRIESVVAERTKSVLSKYSAMDIIETRADISPEVEKYVKEAIDESYCVDVTYVRTVDGFPSDLYKTEQQEAISAIHSNTETSRRTIYSVHSNHISCICTTCKAR